MKYLLIIPFVLFSCKTYRFGFPRVSDIAEKICQQCDSVKKLPDGRLVFTTRYGEHFVNDTTRFLLDTTRWIFNEGSDLPFRVERDREVNKIYYFKSQKEYQDSINSQDFRLRLKMGDTLKINGTISIFLYWKA